MTAAPAIDWPSFERHRARLGIPSADAIWAEQQMQGLPASWAARLSREWQARRPRDPLESAGDVIDVKTGKVLRQGANSWLRETVAKIRAAVRAGIEPGATDGEICRRAVTEARLMRDWLQAVAARVAKALRPKGRAPEWIDRAALRLQSFAARADLDRRGLLDFWPKGRGLTRGGKLKRLVCDRWWRRTLRKAHAFMVESQAIGLGIVRKGVGLYVSDDSLKRRTGQRARNARSLEAVACVNTAGDHFTLADVAARGVANSAVRRAELMTRISGFEVIAHDCGHPADFITVTCPSRMHRWKRGEGQAVANARYDGTLPNQAQAYLAKQWQRLRAAAARRGLGLYGFRIAEPHHDGCPHWHLLLWYPPRTTKGAEAGPVLRDLLTRYFRLNDSPNERGADEHRITVEAIDAAKGSAVAYVAKYVAKNIDGYSVGNDMYGTPALESSQRVEAWASTWRVRQFQQVGGPPVTVWRELRRVHPFLPTADAVDAAFEGLGAVNLSALSQLQGDALTSEVDEATRIRQGWAAYTRLQGGPTAKRKAHTLRLWREQSGEINRYGELGAPAPRGVLAFGMERARVGACLFDRPRVDRLESERSVWAVVPLRGVENLLAVHAAVAADEQARAALKAEQVAAWWADHGQELQRRGEAVAPWTRVNNCTQGEGGGLVAADVTHAKTGRPYRWRIKKPNGGVQTMRPDHEPDPPDHHPDPFGVEFIEPGPDSCPF